ncbi:MAG: histidine phosphatase family protein, partial [Phormidium sp.]
MARSPLTPASLPDADTLPSPSLEDRPLATTVILVRHGQSTYNLEQRMQGRCNKSVLTPAGQDSARLVGHALQGVSLNALYCSPLARAQETAE